MKKNQDLWKRFASSKSGRWLLGDGASLPPLPPTPPSGANPPSGNSPEPLSKWALFWYILGALLLIGLVGSMFRLMPWYWAILVDVIIVLGVVYTVAKKNKTPWNWTLSNVREFTRTDIAIGAVIVGVLVFLFAALPWFMAVFVAIIAFSFLFFAVSGLLYIAKTRNIWLFWPEQGKAYIVEVSQEFLKVIMSHTGYHLNDPGDPAQYDYLHHEDEGSDWYEWYVLPNRWDRTAEDRTVIKNAEWKDRRPWILKKLGAHWLSIWPNVKVKTYVFAWKEWEADREGILHIRSRTEPTNFVFVKTFPYAISLLKTEIIGRMRVDTNATVQIRCCNPKIAIAKNDEWFIQTEAYILDSLRRYQNDSTYDELTAAAQAPKTPTAKKIEDPITDLILQLNEDVPGLKKHAVAGSGQDKPIGVRRLLGVEIVSIKIDQIELSDQESERIVAALTAQKAAEEEGKALVIEQGYKAKGLVKIGEGEGKAAAARISLAYQAVNRFGDLGKLIRQMEALEKSGEGEGNTVVWANNPFSSGLPSELQTVLTNAGITPAELPELLRRVKQLKGVK